MSVLTVGSVTYPTIAAAMAAANPGDTLSLMTGYANDSAIDTVQNLSVTGDGTSTGINLTLGGGVGDVTLLGLAPINVSDNSGANTISGNGGDNVITVTAGGDVVHGGGGIDRLIVDYSLVTATLTGTMGGVTDGGTHSVTFDGIENVTFLTGSGNDTMTAGDGDNLFVTGLGNDTITTGNGHNTIDAGGGNDTMTAGDGGNFVDGGLGDDTITTGTGADEIVGGAGNDTINAGAGNDLITGGAGDDLINGGLGVDTASYMDATNGVHVSLLTSGAQFTGDGTDTLVSIEKLVGSGFGDTLIANIAGATLNGGGGADDLVGGAGNDILNGGSGMDFADYSLAAAGVTVNLAIAGFQNTVGAGSDQLVGIEKLVGSNYNDTLTGDSGDNSIFGLTGADVITGGAGQDNLSGGGGADTFVFTALGDSTVAAPDSILDFQAGDHIDLHLIDANTGLGGDQAFHLGGGGGHAGDIVVGAFDGVHTRVSLYVNADATPDAAIVLNGDHAGLTAGDFIL